MESELQGFVELFGVSIDKLAFVTATVYFLTELFKKKFATVFVGGWKTQLLSLVLCGLLAVKIYGMDWEPVATLTVLSWLTAGGVHAARNN